MAQVSTDRAYLSKVTAKERSKYDLGAGLGGVAGLGGLPEDFMAADDDLYCLCTAYVLLLIARGGSGRFSRGSCVVWLVWPAAVM